MPPGLMTTDSMNSGGLNPPSAIVCAHGRSERRVNLFPRPRRLDSSAATTQSSLSAVSLLPSVFSCRSLQARVAVRLRRTLERRPIVLAGSISETEFVALTGQGSPCNSPKPHTTRYRHQRHRLDETPHHITSRLEGRQRKPAWAVGGQFVSPLILCDSVSHVSGTRPPINALSRGPRHHQAPLSPGGSSFGILHRTCHRAMARSIPAPGLWHHSNGGNCNQSASHHLGSALASVASAALFVVFARQLTRRHEHC